ncbi:uncharacterized protein LOC143226968 [Tachypleus tridentatus]|uniref:uncharacterized protein LOC143226968 n=1 Tax=Tachypleus tridentatus TaxID=6853 RepID=UPI003FD23EB4
MDHDGILRVGGKLQQSSANCDMKHPIIIPRKGHFVNLIIKHFHKKVAHQGCTFTIHEIQSQGYWIVGGIRAVSSHFYKCIACSKLRGKQHTQKMGDLPKESQNLHHLSLTLTWIVLDPLRQKLVERSECKKYGLLITCLASKVVHIELLEDMSTDAFFNALWCFLAIRDPV